MASELAVRLWRGGLTAAVLPAGGGVATVLPPHRARMTRTAGAWPFVVPGLTREETTLAGEQAGPCTAPVPLCRHSCYLCLKPLT